MRLGPGQPAGRPMGHKQCLRSDHRQPNCQWQLTGSPSRRETPPRQECLQTACPRGGVLELTTSLRSDRTSDSEGACGEGGAHSQGSHGTGQPTPADTRRHHTDAIRTAGRSGEATGDWTPPGAGGQSVAQPWCRAVWWVPRLSQRHRGTEMCVRSEDTERTPPGSQHPLPVQARWLRHSTPPPVSQADSKLVPRHATVLPSSSSQTPGRNTSPDA